MKIHCLDRIIMLFYDYNKDDMINTAQVNSAYRRICNSAKIPFLGQHALRHTFATRCIESGIPAVVLKEWLGHTDIHITLDTYTDVFNSLNFNSVEKFEEYIELIGTVVEDAVNTDQETEKT